MGVSPEPKQQPVPFRIDAARGSANNFEGFFDHHRDPIARTLALTFGDDELGYEATDEAMARAYQRWDKVSQYDNPEGWVFRVGLNWGRSWIRRKTTAARKAPILVDRSAADRSDQVPIDPDLQAALKRLGREHRLIVVLRFYRDLSIPQIADYLQIPDGTAKSRLNRALKALAEDLGHRDKPAQIPDRIDRPTPQARSIEGELT